ncbi:MAG TPA: efflux transporter outer membrane subunit, partial [Nitrospirota bacterium]|nr:efflux transporter outer membrane subunit [Nitrospirota bacterium]
MSGDGQFKKRIAAAIVTIAVAGCAVGPDFKTPAGPDTNAYTARPLPPETASTAVTGGDAQRLVPGGDIPAEWWSLFHSRELDRLIRQALKDNPTLASAKATLRQSQESVRAFIGSAFLPQVNAEASAVRQKISGAAFGQPQNEISPFTLYNASVTVSYALDFFGGARREFEALRSQVDYQQFQLEGAYLTLTGNIVTAAVQEAVLRAQVRAAQDIIASQEKQLAVVRKQYELGAVSKTDLLAQSAQVAQTRATLPPLVKALDQTRHLLAVLAGRLPSEGATLPEFELEGFELPRELPVSLPSLLVRQRPDIRSGESLLHAASAQIGVATANLYPQINLSGSYGSEALKTNELFKSGSTVWSLGAGLIQPLFHGGELTAKRRAAIAAYDAAQAQYRLIVLQAFQNVADVMRALGADAETLKAQAEAEQAARDTLDLTEKQFQIGAVSYLSLLNAERQYQESKLRLVQAQGAR